jgi:glutathione-independent formaldehyde dehydrogenase
MAANRALIYVGPRKVELQSLEFPKLIGPGGRRCDHGAILKVVSTNICGSDLHIYRGRFVAPPGMVLGHEITGEVIETGRDVEFIKAGDLVSVPFNVACGRCRNCKERHTDICMNVNPDAACGAYGFNLGGWQGGQAEFHMVPYADFNLLKFPDRDQAMDHIRDLTLLSDILPTGFHGCREAGVGPGSTVYIAGAGPVGRAAAASARLVGASCIVVGDTNRERLALVKEAGYEVVDLSLDVPLRDQIQSIVGLPEVDCGVDCVGFEAHGYGRDAAREQPDAVLNGLLSVVRPGGGIGVPGVYTDNDAGAPTVATKRGRLELEIGHAWIKSVTLTTGQCPVMKYHRELMQAILGGRMDYLGKVINVEVIRLDQAVNAYKVFDEGVAKKFVIDPHGSLKKAA